MMLTANNNNSKLEQTMIALSDNGFECAAVGDAVWVYSNNDVLIGKLLVDGAAVLLNGHPVEVDRQLFEDMRHVAEFDQGARLQLMVHN